jgi:uncharacterized membrane protein YkoI
MNNTVMLAALGAGILTAGSALAAHTALSLDRSEAAAIRSAPVTLAKALDIAETQGHGKVMNIVSRAGGPNDLYVVTLADDGHIHWGTVDAVSGAFTPSREAPTPVGKTDHGALAEATLLDHAHLSLRKAVSVAENVTHGKAGDVGIEAMRGGKRAYEVRVVKNGLFYDVWIDPASGQILETTTT